MVFILASPENHRIMKAGKDL